MIAGSAAGPSTDTFSAASRTEEEHNRRLLRARDAIDLAYREPIDVAALASVACMSPAHFIRSFKATFGETPHRYLQRRRIERAMARLRRNEKSVSEICIEVGWASFATFSRTFARSSGARRAPIAGQPPVNTTIRCRPAS